MKKKIVTNEFIENPDNVDIDDWVFFNGKVGQIKDILKKTDDFLQFWVMWDGDTIPSPEMPKNLRKVVRPLAINSQISTDDDEIDFIDLDSLTYDPNLQQRIKLNTATFQEYAEIYREGGSGKMPPITVWYCSENNQNYLVDGFHRVEGARRAGLSQLPFIKKSGTYREAVLYSVGVNSNHGLRRTSEDKRKAVLTLLQDSEWSKWSDNFIAKKTATSQPFVSKFRHSLNDLLDNSDNISDTPSNNVISSGIEVRKYVTEKGEKAEMLVKEGKSEKRDLPPDVTAKRKGLFAIEVEKATIDVLKEFMEKHNISRAENAILKLLGD